MQQNYFMHNGQKYYTGTKIRIRVYNGYGNRPETAEFISYDTDTNKYNFTVNGAMHTYDKRGWSSYLIDVCDANIKNIQPKCKTESKLPEKEWTFRKELDVEGMLNAWMWYGLLMAITTIFKGNVLYWAVISGIFFKYRNEKLRKAGYKA